MNRRPLDYESSALPLSYAGDCPIRPSEDDRPVCPGTDSNRDALRHHPLKMACLPISPPGPLPLLLSAISCQLSEYSKPRYSNRFHWELSNTGATGLEPATSRVTVECSNQTELRPQLRLPSYRLLIASRSGASHRRSKSCIQPFTIARRGIEPLSAP